MLRVIFTFSKSPFTFDLKSHLPGTCVFCGKPHLEEVGKVKHLRRLRIPSLARSLKPQVASLHCLSFPDTVYSSLCSTVGPCCLSILHYDSLLVPNPNPSLPDPATLWQIPVCFLCLWACLFHSWVHLCYILDSTFKWYPMEFVFLFLTYFA